MNIENILAALDQEIARLQHARTVIGGGSTYGPKRRGRPPGSVNKRTSVKATAERTISAAGREAIRLAQKKRWANKRKADIKSNVTRVAEKKAPAKRTEKVSARKSPSALSGKTGVEAVGPKSE